ncbi:pyrroloquinoline quinone biosynthesis protein PqqE [Sandaracinus amylolyticus]|uniref:PqqA peptide cyclase n=1 Tax=Sandaracinus amylolyticus TaxID=927083 RepID=A0A0F6W0D2_9BACT|nr:pyrroloquinoline quinone biosynthesis protein PqqE [Sandaracinus amylolyticus]AKF04256.1 Coenzyme PQQ synthesis protein E [Sandaracinus amylolyticus]
MTERDPHRPYTLIAELTYRCPLRCGHCSNPLDWAQHRDALDTSAWSRVLAEAAELGVVQVHLTGGEPLLRRDLEPLIAAARRADLYTHLVTSGVPLARERLRALRDAGLDAMQLSLHDADDVNADSIAGVPVAAHKREVASWAQSLEIPLTINVVLRGDNIDGVDAIIALAETLGADRLELASTQYLGWALANRSALLPTHAQIERARSVASAARARLRGRMEIVLVLPDYHAGAPRACMEGWARRFVVVSPDGRVLPCHAAGSIPTLEFERVGGVRSLAEIWRSSPALAAFRGDAWMSEPCRSCERRAIDHGGCRCQAHHLAGDAGATDPACDRSPMHHVVVSAFHDSAPSLVQLRARR